MAREKDTRQILSAVELPDQWGKATPLDPHPQARGMTTFAPGDEDALEEAMTPEQLKYLLEQGAIAGNWSAKGKLPEGVPAGPPTVHLGRHRKAADIRTQHLADAAQRQKEQEESAQPTKAEKAEAAPEVEIAPAQESWHDQGKGKGKR